MGTGGDIRQPQQILASPSVRELTESGQPLALMLLGILHHVNDRDNPADIAATLRRALPPGSYVAVSHFCNPGSEDSADLGAITKTEELYAETLGTGRWRSYNEILAYFGDLELLEPGLVPLADWHPSPRTVSHQHTGHHSFIGGVARTR